VLKLERSSKGSDLTIIWRDQEHFFNSLFWQALGIALMLHLGAFLIFHIQAFKIESSFVFPPIKVGADYGSFSTANTLLLADQNQEELTNLPPPPLFDSSFPKLVFNHLQSQQLPLPSLELINHAFDSIEHRALNLIHPSAPFPIFYYPIQMHLTGELADHPFTQEDSLILMTPLQKKGPLKHFHIRYQVQIDDLSGQVFWYDKKQTSGISRLDELAEKILLSLKFDPNFDSHFLVGEIYFVMTISTE
jgi:hypothetical protein